MSHVLDDMYCTEATGTAWAAEQRVRELEATLASERRISGETASTATAEIRARITIIET